MRLSLGLGVQEMVHRGALLNLPKDGILTEDNLSFITTEDDQFYLALETMEELQ